MILATMLFLAGTAATAAATPGADTIRHLKGHHSLPVAAPAQSTAKAPAVCHSDPLKGRACRHHAVQAEQREARAMAYAPSANAARDTAAR